MRSVDLLSRFIAADLTPEERAERFLPVIHPAQATSAAGWGPARIRVLTENGAQVSDDLLRS